MSHTSRPVSLSRLLTSSVLAVLLLAGCSGETSDDPAGGDTGALPDSGDVEPGDVEPTPDTSDTVADTSQTTQPDADIADAADTADTTDPVDMADTADTTEPPAPGDWRLPEGYYVPAKMPMTLVHPRNDDVPAWAYARNAHPGVRWEIPIVVQGGAWPFQYEIVDHGGAEGLSLGAELERTVEDGHVVHRVTRDYGVLWWDEPIEGTFEIVVRVHDQDGESLDVPISLTVGTEGWIFVDGQSGDDTANDGSVDSPFATLERIHQGGEAFADHRVYLSGVVAMDGNRDNGNLRVAFDTPAPRVWVGLPGGDAVLEAYEGHLVLDAPDFYLANLEHRHHQDYQPDTGSFLHMITVWGDTDRYTVHDVHFSRFHGTGANVNLGNSSIMMLTKNDVGRQHVAVVNNTLSGPNGILTSSYDLRHSVFEKNRAIGADFQIADGSVWAQIYIKAGNNEFVTLRANEFWDANTWDNGYSALGVLQARHIELAYNTIHTPYDAGRRGAIKLWTNSPQASYSWTEQSKVWLYRNSLKQRISYEGDALANMPDGTVIFERNVLDTGTIPLSSRILDTDNLAGQPLLDEQMKLADEQRATNLGRYGAEIAAPL